MSVDRDGQVMTAEVKRVSGSSLRHTAPETGAVGGVRRCLEHVRAYDFDVNAVITVVDEPALAEAAAADASAVEGRSLGALHGMPVMLKDNIATAGIRPTSGSKFFADSVPAVDAEVVRRLKRAGAIIVGKTNMAELALGGTTQNRHFGRCRNPWDLDRVPGGSSGGSAAAVASDMCAGALGTDTGGSIRIPAALTGVAGLRPTAGRVSNRGTTPVSPEHDTVGPIARTVVDVARLFATIADDDGQDSTPAPHSLEGLAATLGDPIGDPIDGVRIGLPSSFCFDRLHPEIADAVRTATATLERLGAQLHDIDLPEMEPAFAAARGMIIADAAAVHRERLAERPDDFASDVRVWLRDGAAIRPHEYAGFLDCRRTWRRTVAERFRSVDLVLSPTVGMPAPRIAECEAMTEVTLDLTRLTTPWAFAGVPALSVPCGFSTEGLPIGLQLVAAWGRESLLLRVGAAYQSVTDWHLARPALLGGVPCDPGGMP